MPEILIVDDDILLVEALRTKLSRLGYQASTASTLAEARKKNLECRFDIIF